MYRVFDAFAPRGVVTTTLAAPAEPEGVVQVIVVALTTLRLVAALPPMVTPVAPVKSVPEIVTLVPPKEVPLAGAILSTVGSSVALGSPRPMARLLVMAKESARANEPSPKSHNTARSTQEWQSVRECHRSANICGVEGLQKAALAAGTMKQRVSIGERSW